MMLCHHVGGDGATALLDDVERRLTHLAGDNVILACPTLGVTTTAMRDRVAAWADGLRTGVERPAVSVRLPRRTPVRTHRVMETGAFFFVYLALVVLMAVSIASAVAIWERSACKDDCVDRPATFATALEWVRYRLVWQDPPELRATTVWARTSAVTIGVLGPLTVLMAAGSLAHYRRYRATLWKEYLAMMDEALGRDRILLVVATDVDRMDRGEGHFRLGPGKVRRGAAGRRNECRYPGARSGRGGGFRTSTGNCSALTAGRAQLPGTPS